MLRFLTDMPTEAAPGAKGAGDGANLQEANNNQQAILSSLDLHFY